MDLKLKWKRCVMFLSKYRAFGCLSLLEECPTGLANVKVSTRVKPSPFAGISFEITY